MVQGHKLNRNGKRMYVRHALNIAFLEPPSESNLIPLRTESKVVESVNFQRKLVKKISILFDITVTLLLLFVSLKGCSSMINNVKTLHINVQ